MFAQSSNSPEAAGSQSDPAASLRRTRTVILILTALLAVGGEFVFLYLIANDSRINGFEILSAILFPLLFGWISFSFVLAVLGWWRCRQTQRHGLPLVEPAASLDRRAETTAVLMPIYNESPVRVLAGVEAMIQSLRDCERLGQFEFYILSDTTRYEVWLDEEWRWSRLTATNPDAVVHYRHRPRNTSRKAGNIADFCRRWGGHHPYMIVLDADSLMVGDTMVEMVRRMDANPELGILQVPPRPIGRMSPFARLQQFSAAVYGSIFIEGFAAWSGSQGNYWGHNAIIRIQPFCEHCELPVLSGSGPLGGEILSHDFVEAALMVKNGWKVELAGDLSGSYEECPTTITDYAIRDNRWCQGNLQHSKLLISEGFNPLSRTHFASGLMSYIASPIWLTFTVVCIGGLIWERFDENAAGETSPVPAVALFIVSMAMLLLPKFLAVSVYRRSVPPAMKRKVRRSALLEIVTSILLSPIMALYHSRFVFSTLAGLKVRWNAQTRDETGVSWSDAVNSHWVATAIGVVATIGLAYLSPGLLAWFTPLLLGLWLAIPLAVWMGSPGWGNWLRDRGWLLIPEEVEVPAIVHHLHRAESTASASKPRKAEELFAAVIADPKFFALHRGIQRATDSDIALDRNQTKAIEAAMSAGGPARIPVEVRGALLADSETLLALHLESQI